MLGLVQLAVRRRVSVVMAALAVVAFGEPFARGRAVGFVVIWCALALYARDTARALRALAERLGVTPQAVRRRVERAIAKLRTHAEPIAA